MKTKILSILALLLTVTQGAWAQVGRVLATDGKYYKTVTAATNAGTTASGMIVYWGDGDTSDNTYNQGLVIKLSDVANNVKWGEQQDVTGITNTGQNAASSMVDLRGIANTDAIVSKWPVGVYPYAAPHCRNISTARPSSSSNWFLPSQGQFVLMMNSYGAGYGTSTDYAYDNMTKGTVVTAINQALTNAGGTALSNGRYWTSTEVNQDLAADWSASNSSFGFNGKTDGHYIRAMFAFSGATAAEYTVSYNANGGSGAPSAQTKDGGIDLTLSSTVPTRTGYTFAGWNTQADGNGTPYAAGANYSANAAVTLYAQWTPTYTATFATGNDNTGWTIDPTSGAEGATVTVSYSGENKVKSVKVKAIPTVTLSKTALDFDADYYKGSTQTFTVTRDGDGAITATSSNTGVATVSVDGNTVTVTRKYPGEGSAVITVSVAATESYAAAANQTVNVTFSSMSRHLGGVEAKNKGWFLGADGYVYPSIAAATNADTEARAVIAHVGAIEKYCDHAICLALEDAAGADVWSNATSAAQSWAASHAVSLGGTNFNTSHTSYDIVQNNASVSSQTRNEGIGYGWRIPSVTDWRYIMQAFGGPSATSPVGVAMAVYGNTVREAINTACGNSGLYACAYWTCSTLTGTNPADYWGVHFQNENDKDVFWTYGQSENPNLRLVFAY